MARRLSSHGGARPGDAHAALYHARRRRRAAQDFKDFEGDIASPFDLGTVAATTPLPNPYVMPANSRLAISFSTGITQGQLTVDIGAKTVETTALSADEIYRLEVGEEAEEIIPTAAIAGTVTLYVLDEWQRPSAIATGTFT